MKLAAKTLASLLLACTMFTSVVQANDTSSILKALTTGNHFALLRHALAPGMADPVQFDVNDCETQRNLNEIGREQAKAIGETLRTAGVENAQVFSSQWCRCLETARLLNVGSVEELQPLNSFFEERHKSDVQTKALRNMLSEMALEQPVILVTHQVNITALTGEFAQSGELVIVKRLADNTLQVIGKLKMTTD